MYFNAVLLMRAVSRAAPYLEAYDIGTAPNTRLVDEKILKKRSEDKAARNTLKEVLALAEKGESGFDEKDFFAGEDSLVSAILRIIVNSAYNFQLLKEQFKTHFRNVSRIMDCVGCDKCRLWGKLQVSGLGTALKILFELDEEALE